MRIEDIAGLSDDEIGRTEEDVKINVVVSWLELLGHRLKFEHDKNDILIKHGDFIVVVETKKLGVELSKFIDQLGEYVARRRAYLAILTNGQDFLIFSPFWRKKSFRETLILSTKRSNLADPEISTLISDSMSHDSMANESAKNAIEKREKEIDHAIQEVSVELNTRRNENVEIDNKIKVLQKEIETLSERMRLNNRTIENLSRDNLLKLSCWYDFSGTKIVPFSERSKSTKQVVISSKIKITQDDLISAILEALNQYNGRARHELVIDYVYEKYKDIFKQEHYQETVSGEIRWRNQIRWARNAAKDRELLKPTEVSGRGIWEWTTKGMKFVER